MTDIKEQIFTELDILESNCMKLRSNAAGASRQTDLEIAILSQQLGDMRTKNARAKKLVDESISILTKMKRPKK